MKTAEGKPIELVESAAGFAALVQRLGEHRQLALDTEFMRTNTFYPLLGLIQLADTGCCYLVDPLAVNDTKLLGAFLSSTDYALVLHSCSEDLNLLYSALNIVPAAVFDTQIAAAFLGLGFSLSYQALVLELLGINIPKDETRSDWLQRPLSDTQKVYAATDVCHLLELHELMQVRLKSKGVYDWFEMECKDLLGVAPQSELAANWEFSYAGVNNAWRLSDRGLQFLQVLCSWREVEARRRNKPRSWIAKDADLLQIAAGMSREAVPALQKLLEIPGVDKHIINRYGGELLQLLNLARVESTVIDRDLLNNPLTPGSRNKLKACQQAVQQIASELTIAPELLGRKRIILELVREYEHEGAVDWSTAVTGWRRELLEPALAPILNS